MKGLIVRQPYAKWIVEGKKVWEIRKTPTRIRGRIVIISEKKALGTVELVEVLGPFTPEELADHESKHLASYDFLKRYSNGKKLYAWVFANPVKFDPPREVEIPNGAQIWVNLKNWR